MSKPTPQPQYIVLGGGAPGVRDVYLLFLRASWSLALTGIVAVYMTLNTLFALGYLWVGGVGGARAGSFWDAFCFSVETMGTIGYGAMFPQGRGANAIMIVESVTSLMVTAVATGLIFAKFTRSSARIFFMRHACIAPMDGVPTLMLRIGNERANPILEASARLTMTKTTRTLEGETFYRLTDLKLSRERSPAMSRTWTVMHPVDESSPLYGQTPETLKRDEVEFTVTLVGVDDTSLQPVHARKVYVDTDILWGMRPANVLSEGEDGAFIVDMRRFHDVVPSEPLPEFPYPCGETDKG